MLKKKQDQHPFFFLFLSFVFLSLIIQIIGYKAAFVLGLIPQLFSAAVLCNSSTTANNGDICTSLLHSGVQSLQSSTLNLGVSCPTLTVGQGYCVVSTVTSEPGTTTKATTTATSTTTKAATTMTSF